MAQVKAGDKVRIDYTGKLEDGTVFDSTVEDECCDTDGCGCDDGGGNDCCGEEDCGCESGPMVLTVGSGEFFSQIDDALIGMNIGDKATVVIPAADAFGEYDKERIFTVPCADLPEDMNPEVGDEMVIANEEDEELGVVVLEVTEESVTFDANHPLAGEDLTFEIALLEIL